MTRTLSIVICMALGALNTCFVYIASSPYPLFSAWSSGWCFAFAAALIVDILKGE